jgi:YwiC-like protein
MTARRPDPKVRYVDGVTPPIRPAARPIPTRHLWIPRQHGAWAMLLMPVLLGIAASRPSPWQLVLAAAALAAFLGSATAQAWSRARRPPAYRAPIAVYGLTAAVLGLVLVIAFPPLLLAAIVIVPTALIVFGGARPGTPRDLANSLVQVVQALVLVPAAAWVSGAFEVEPVVAYTLVAAGYLFGTVLVVRSVLRERGNEAFALLSVGFHVILAVAALLALPVAYAALAGGLAIRAAALPIVQRRRAGGPKPLRPIHVGIVEIMASLAVVLVSFAVPI